MTSEALLAAERRGIRRCDQPSQRLAANHPQLVQSFAAIETALPGFGMELLADVAHGGMWHIGFVAAPGIPGMLLAGREREFLAGYAFPAMCGTQGAISERDIDEFIRVYSRPDGSAGPPAPTGPCSPKATRSGGSSGRVG